MNENIELIQLFRYNVNNLYNNNNIIDDLVSVNLGA